MTPDPHRVSLAGSHRPGTRWPRQGATMMTVSIRPAASARPAFAGEVEGVDLRQPLSPEDVRAIDAGMDQYGVLVFHDQELDDERQLAFSRNFGEIELATGDIAQGAERRLGMEVNDISNLD